MISKFAILNRGHLAVSEAYVCIAKSVRRHTVFVAMKYIDAFTFQRVVEIISDALSSFQ